jgi:hypothetical protein
MTLRRYALVMSFLYVVAGSAHAGGDDWSFDAPGDQPAVGHGHISIGLQGARTQGLVSGTGEVFNEALTTDVRSMTLGIEYWLGEQWSLHASLPFISKRALNDTGLHDQTRLVVPRPESTFIDDGQFHSAWQDWQLGLAFHRSLGRFDIDSHAVFTYPSHDYIFFASAPVGQGLKKLRIGADVSQRIGQSNLHYSVGYSYEFVERIKDIPVGGVQYGNINTDNQYLRLSAWYDFSPQLSVRVFGNRRTGKGLVNSEVRSIDPFLRSELWYQHDRLLQYNYAIAGLGSTWDFNDQWSVSASAATMVWVRVNHDMKYAYELQLLRRF